MPDPVTHYQGAAGRQYHDVKRGVPEKARPWLARLRAAKIQPYVRSTDVVLEYGVGAGWNLAQLAAARRIGFDVADFLGADLESQGIEFVTDVARLDPALAGVVVCHHALEHILSPAAALADMRRLLQPGGRLLLWVPFEDERRHRRFERGEKNHHLYSWNVQTLGNLVEACGFRVIEAGLARYGWDRFTAAWAVRLGVGERGFRWLRALLQTVRPLREVHLRAE
jgi:SAM-dependent methyltransferase